MTSKEALNDIKKRNNALKEEGHFHIGTKVMSVIEELVERDTPMKPAQDNSHVFRQYNCKVCNSRLDIPQLKEVNFCPKCGNRIDWS